MEAKKINILASNFCFIYIADFPTVFQMVTNRWHGK